MDINWQKVDALSGGLTKSELYNEALFALGGQYAYKKLTLPQPTAGSFMLLEIIGSPFLTGENVEDIDIDTALYILVMEKEGVSAVFEDRLFDVDIKTRVEDFANTIPKYNRSIIRVFLNTYFKYCMNGFDMMPKEDGMDGQPKRMTFDTDWLASYVSICNKITGYDMDYITWKMPLISGGFCIARYGRENGQKGIERPQDWKAQLEELRKQIDGNK